MKNVLTELRAIEKPAKVFIDLGNDSIKFYSGNSAQVVPSVYAPFDSSKTDLTTDSIVINDIIYGDRAAYQADSKTFAQTDKATLLPQAWKVAVGTELSGKTIDLVVSVPDAKQDHPDLTGDHRWTRNGLSMAVTVRTCRYVNESEGSFWMAKAAGVVRDGLTMVLDIGAGTTIASLYSREGSQVDRVVMDGQGVIRIAKDICKAIGKTASPRVSQVLAGLKDKTCSLGVSDTSFQPYVSEAVEAWTKAVMSRAQNIRKGRENMISGLVLTGGGAALLSAYKPEWVSKTLPDAQIANLHGMVKHYG
jgi:hypothetical protein